ncbi:type-F conjugative transfer system pilin assembly protein TrbC [Novosphingobium percolationis]|uniref:type-F conjugative transfer system pilin assembly protein TrbC n=1 Tax=Novosphingobium percolationis TaxID=2871811 RepID=UPI001CD63D11|nr:type-F conjugative transfer system pilin assembly protein TrbC [Novosphingobium percolationis]
MTGVGSIGAALAQASPGIDLAAIRAQAAAQIEEAQALARTARDRAAQLRPEAQAETDAAIQRARSSTATTRGKIARQDGTFDFDSMVATAGNAALSAMGTGPRFIAFASTSMPASALRQMIEDVPRAGGVVVFRGLREGSARAMTAALTGVFQPGEHIAGIGIDPRLFRAFHVESVPTYVMGGSDFDLCDGLDCSTAVPPFDVMTGNVTAAYALETFARGGGPGARLAAQHLARLERPAP